MSAWEMSNDERARFLHFDTRTLDFALCHAAVGFDEFFGLDEHAAGATGGVGDAAFVGDGESWKDEAESDLLDAFRTMS